MNICQENQGFITEASLPEMAEHVPAGWEKVAVVDGAVIFSTGVEGDPLMRLSNNKGCILKVPVVADDAPAPVMAELPEIEETDEAVVGAIAPVVEPPVDTDTPPSGEGDSQTDSEPAADADQGAGTGEAEAAS